jgi:urease accessory protein
LLKADRLQMNDAALLAILQLADSFFPSGMVTLSHGLEAFVSVSRIAPSEIPRLLDDYLSGKIAPCDLVSYAHAYRAAEVVALDRLHRIDQQLTASVWPQELRQASVRSGRAMLQTLTPLVEAPLLHTFTQGIHDGHSEGNASVCLGLLCALWQIPVRAGGIIHLYTFAVSFVGAAMRLGCLGHREAQRILLTLRPRFSLLVDDALGRGLDEMSAFAPLADIHAMQHAYLPVRLFGS